MVAQTSTAHRRMVLEENRSRTSEQFEKVTVSSKTRNSSWSSARAFWYASAWVEQALAQLGHDRRSSEVAERAVELSADLPREPRLSLEARAATAADRWDEAIGLYRALERSVELKREIDDTSGLAVSLTNVASIAEARRAYMQARDRWRGSSYDHKLAETEARLARLHGTDG